MDAGDSLGQVEFVVLEAVHRGVLRSRPTAQKIAGMSQRTAGQAILHEALHRCEHDGLLRSERVPAGRRYELTAAGRRRLSADRRFRVALVRLLIRGETRDRRRSGSQLTIGD
jgi:DNA-binding PadR family transcriptional regulator